MTDANVVNVNAASWNWDSWNWHSPAARKVGDAGVHARMYLRMMAQSDYAERLAPVVGQSYSDVLDIGAGGGSVTRHCLAAGARWCAVEPNPTMGEALAAQIPELAVRGIRLEHHATNWQDMPGELRADTVFAFNLGDNHHAADALFDALSRRAAREMVWIVPAQAAPASFCLAGFLPAEFHGKAATSRQPAIERALEQLGTSRQPACIDYVDWQCRFNFTTRRDAAQHFFERLDFPADSAQGRALSAYLDRTLHPAADGWPTVCAKRSAVVRWFFS